MSHKFEAGKEYKTRDGRRAVVLSDKHPCVTGWGRHDLVGVVIDRFGTWQQFSWDANGCCKDWTNSTCADLMPPGPREWWVLVSENPGSAYDTAYRDPFVARGREVVKVIAVVDGEQP